MASLWMILGEWRAHPARIFLAVLAITIGVALGFAVHLVNGSALDSFAGAIRTVSGDADLQVHATTPAGFDEALYPTLARLDGIATASPVVELTVSIRPGETMSLLGLDVLRAVMATPGLAGHAAATGRTDVAFDPTSLYLSSGALNAMARQIGDVVTLQANGRHADFKIVGTLPAARDGAILGVIDIAAAQWRFGLLGRLQRIDLRLAPGTDRGHVEALVRAALPADAELVSAADEAESSDSLSRAYRVNLDMLAMVALLTGGFLVYSAQSLSVARRQPQFAVLRILGLRRGTLTAQLVAEGLVLGIVGGLAGLGVGFGLAVVALDLFGGDLGGGYFSGRRPDIALQPVAAGIFLILGIAVSLAGSLMPARAAALTRPAVALKNAGEAGDPRWRPRPWAGVAAVLLGGMAAMAPPIGGLPLFGYAAIALILAGGVAAMPWLVRLLVTPLGYVRRRGVVLDLSIMRILGALGPATIALSGIVASAGLTIAMAVMVSSFRGSVDDWLVRILPADLYLRVENGEAGGLDRDAQRRLAAAPGVASIRFRKTILLRLEPGRPPVALVAQPDPAQTLPLIGATQPVASGDTPVWTSEPMVRLYGARVGDHLQLPLGQKGLPVTVAGVWRDYARQHGAVVIDDDDYTRLTGDMLRTEASVDLEPGATAVDVTAALRAALPPDFANATIAPSRQIRDTALRVFDRSFAITYALEAIAILVGLAGVAATVSAQTLARTKEFGMLRHIGMRRGEIVRTLATEGALLGAIGGVAGTILGLVIGEVLIQVVNPQSFHWTMETRVPFGMIAIVAASLVAASAGTAVLAGRRAVSGEAVRAVREDW